MLAEIIGIDKNITIAFMLGIIVGTMITSYFYEKQKAEREEEYRKKEFLDLSGSEHG